MKKARTKQRKLKLKGLVESRVTALTKKGTNLLSALTDTRRELNLLSTKLVETETTLKTLQDKYEPKAPEAPASAPVAAT